jgi:16S rRNA (cytidine1402-2'-O)-methyltransferase
MTGRENKPVDPQARPVSDPSPVSAAALAPGLHLVATPIGTARDITLRALDTLREADVIASEDTRTTRRLLEIHGIPLGGRPILAYHDHNGAKMRPEDIEAAGRGPYGLCLGRRNAACRGSGVSAGAGGDRGGHECDRRTGPSAALGGADAVRPAERPVPVRRVSTAAAGARRKWIAPLMPRGRR